MKIFKTYLHALKGTCTSLAYYKDVVKARFNFSLKFYMFSSILLALAVTIRMGIFILPTSFQALDSVGLIAEDMYPNDLVIGVENGQFWTNAEEPVIISINDLIKSVEKHTEEDWDESNWEGFDPEAEEFTNALVIDMGASVENAATYSTLALITRDAFVYHDDGKYSFQTIEDSDFEFSLNEERALAFVDVGMKYARLAVYALPFVFFIGIMLYKNLVLLLLFLTGIFFSVVSSGSSKRLSASKFTQILMHISVPYALITMLLNWFEVNPPIPFQAALFYVITTVIIHRKLDPAPELPENPPSPEKKPEAPAKTKPVTS